MDHAAALAQPLAPVHPAEGADHGHGHAHSAHLAHHFDSLEQQFNADKFGMWLFLVTEIMFFSGLFCAYAVYRSNHPEIFMYADHFLDRNLGAVNTVVLLFSSLTMAWGVRCAQLSQQRGLQICLALTLACAFGFLGIKYVEYKAKWEHGLLWGEKFKPTEHLDKHGHVVHDSHDGGAGGHGAEAAGGHGSAPAAGASHGAEPSTGQPAIPAAGPMAGGTKAIPPGVSSAPAPMSPSPAAPVASTSPTGAALSATVAPTVAPHPVQATTPVVPPSPSTTSGPAPASIPANPATPAAAANPTPPVKFEEISMQPSNVQIFFGIYFCMTGLHAIHILVGIALITWLLIRSYRGEFTDGYYTPVDLIGLYWHIVDMIWIYLFPLLYLIH